MKALLLLAALASFPAFAFTPAHFAACVQEKANEVAQEHRNRRGGECEVVALAMPPAKPGWIAPSDASGPIHGLNSTGKVTINCGSSLFFPAQTFTRSLSVHLTDDNQCWGGQVGWQL